MAQENKFTAGEWIATKPEVSNGYLIIMSGEKDLLSDEVCTIYGNGESNWPDAQLIAAAPDLLEALESFPADCLKHGDMKPVAIWLSNAQQAIIKARGE